MRLNKYINETTAPTMSNAKFIIQKGMPKFAVLMRGQNWTVADRKLIDILDTVYNSNSIMFNMAKKSNTKGVSKYIDEVILHGDGKGRINVIQFKLRKGGGAYFSKYSKSNPSPDEFSNVDNEMFFRDLMIGVSHELLHIQQLRTSVGKSIKDIATMVARVEKEGTQKPYFSYHAEVEAFAQDAAQELHYIGKSRIIDKYRKEFGIKSKVFKKFMKKVVYYQGMIK